MKFETKAIRIQTDRSQHREHSTPIFPTSSFVFEDAEQMRSLFAGEEKGNIYSRFTNPSCREFEMKMAALEGVDDAVSAASGMGAVFASLMTFLKAGDHVLASRALFGSTYNVISVHLPKWGIGYDWVDPADMSSWASKVKPNTKMLFLETPSNPGLEILDLEAAGKFAKAHDLIFNVDNCFATPYLQRPSDFGADLVLHSATKYIDGQGRVLGGAIVGKEALVQKCYDFIRRTGACLSPFNAWILSKSLETIAVRMDRHCSNSLAIAQWLENESSVQNVTYPFLPSHPQYSLATQQMKLGGGLIGFEINGGVEAGRQFLNNLKIHSLTANLGDCRSIATHPSSTTHSKLNSEEQLSMGITPGYIRLSVGLENVEDLKKDIDQSLKKINNR